MVLKISRKDNFRRLLADDDKFAEMLIEAFNNGLLDSSFDYCQPAIGGCPVDDCPKELELKCLKRWLNEEIIVETKEDTNADINN